MKVAWQHDRHEDLDREPSLLYHEVDDDGREKRRVEFFLDGRKCWADSAGSAGGAGLSLVPLGSIEEIATQDEFAPSFIVQEEFEQAWRDARREC